MSVVSRPKPVVAVVAVVALGLLGALAYLALDDRLYEAEAALQVVPLPADDSTFAGFALPRASEVGSAAATVADLVERPAVVDAAAVRVRLDREDVLEAVSVDVEDASNVVTVRAESDNPRRAAQIANAVADAFVAERSAVFQGDLNRTIAELRDRVRGVPASERDPDDVSRLAALEASLGEPDPTLRVAGNAVARDDPVSPRPLPVLAATLAGSLALGLVVALALAARDRPSTPEGAAVAKREATLAQRVKAVTVRERALARRAGELAKRERRLEQQAARPEPPPLHHPPAERAPDAPAPVRDGEWNVNAIERLVAERGDEFPDRVEEWRTYLFLLREHASPEGVLPPSFGALIDETFAELLR